MIAVEKDAPRITAAVPDGLRWRILTAALAGDERRHAELLAEAEGIARRAAALRARRAAQLTGEGRLF